MEDLEGELLKYKIVGEFLVDIRKEFEGGDKEAVKVTELRRIKQRGKTMEEYVQEFWRAARGSRYEGRLLVKEFKKKMNRIRRRKLMEIERPSTSIEQ